jgi:eukaryotic-like serine/threonine-protein kinase
MYTMDDHKGERFGRYQILAELGRGTMGIVYKARDPKINRVVAVKTISLEGQLPEEELEYRERFFREAEAAGRLSHPGIVTIFDVGEEPETRAPYIVMEFVGGPSLDKLLSGNDRKISLERALQLILELADALECAHGQGVVHRDLKPANILLTEDGHAKIADFGVAKLNLANYTLGGRVLGTPAYMSPEQLNGEAVDGRSDLFSLGVILYTVLTGYRPFQGNSTATVSFKVVNREPVPATVLDTELPRGVDYIIARAMSKDPAQRYQRGMEMARDVQELLEGREPWSKAKQPGSSAGADGEQTANQKAISYVGQLSIAGKPRSSTQALPPEHAAAAKLLEKMRKNSLAGAALFLFGLLIFGIRVGPLVWPRRVPPQSLPQNLAGTRTAPPKPLAAEVPPLQTASTPAVPAANAVTTVAAAPRPNVKKIPKPVRAGNTYPPPVKVARASSPSPAISPALLEIEVDHKFAEAQLSIWVDDRLSFSHLLEGTDKKHLVVFHRVQGHESHAMQISPGNHRLRVQVTSGAATYDQSTTGEFASGQENVLRINFNKHGEMNLSLQ